jgi:hypothetical protein
LFAAMPGRMSAAMHPLPACLTALALIVAIPAAAAPQHAASRSNATAAAAPKEIGQFKNWIAATHPESGQTTCYAFTRAGNENPATGTGPVLSVTDRPSGRDQVAISGGPTYPKDSTMTLQVDQAGLDFYTAGRDAFARDNKAAVAAFQRGSTAIARVPAAHGTQTLTFNLDGFSAAHDAMGKACPGK